MNRVIRITLIALFITAVTTVSALAAENKTNSISGVIYHDLNRNGIQDLNEKAIPFAMVNVQERGSDLIESLVADENGNFNSGGLAFGTYQVWSEANNTISTSLTFEVNELNANAIITLGINGQSLFIESAEPEMIELQTLLLPIVMG